MTLPSFKRAYPAGADARQVEDNVANAVGPVLRQPILGGVLVKSVALKAAGPTAVNHGLGRKYQGWWLVDNNADCRIWSGISVFPDKQLTLYTSGDTTVSLWVF